MENHNSSGLTQNTWQKIQAVVQEAKTVAKTRNDGIDNLTAVNPNEFVRLIPPDLPIRQKQPHPPFHSIHIKIALPMGMVEKKYNYKVMAKCHHHSSSLEETQKDLAKLHKEDAMDVELQRLIARPCYWHSCHFQVFAEEGSGGGHKCPRNVYDIFVVVQKRRNNPGEASFF